jgi:probable phosphoglycerate mutase
VQGQSNTKLTQRGIVQAEKIARRLKAENIKTIYTSDLERAYRTATIIGDSIGANVIKIKELREINFGLWQGLTINEIKELYSDEHTLWMKEPHKLTIKGAESLIKVKERTMSTVNLILKKHYKENIAIVSHSAVIKVIILSILDIDLSNYNKISLDNSSLSIIEYRDYNPVIRLLNDTSHLREVYNDR